MKINPDRRALLAGPTLSACATPSTPDLNFSNELRDTPPDDVIVLWPDGAPMFSALRVAQVLTELHVFDEGGHGFGLRFVRDKPAGAWPVLSHAWASRHGVFAV